MSIRGVRQLKALTLRYCDWGGSSRGARAYIQKELVPWATDNPAVTVSTAIKRNKHPVLIAEYVWGQSKVLNVDNKNVSEIGLEVQRLRNSSGRKMTRFKEPVKSETPSLQGVWNPAVPIQTLEFELVHQA